MLPTQYRCNEAVQLLFDPRQTSYEALCEVLWRRIDPTLRNQVGLDRGATYRHALYVHTAEQLVQATASVEARQLALAPATVWQRGQVPPSRASACRPGRLGRTAPGPGCSTLSGGAPQPPPRPQWWLMMRPSARAKVAGFHCLSTA